MRALPRLTTAGASAPSKKPQDKALADTSSWRFFAGINGFLDPLWKSLGYLTSTEPLPSKGDPHTFWNQCQHQSWYFLPWHRGYLIALEDTIRAAVVKQGGPSEWALPYWNYFDNNQLPPAFASTTWPCDGGANPLYVPQRCMVLTITARVRTSGSDQFESVDRPGLHRRFKWRKSGLRWCGYSEAELSPVEYFHVVFTLPEPLAAIALQNKAVVYSLLFRTAAETMLTIARDPKHLGAEIGFFAILHTWVQNLLHHPHLHCVVPGGGLSPGYERWMGCRPGFFLPVKVLSRLFRRLFLESLRKEFAAGRLQCFGDLASLRERPAFTRYLRPLEEIEWVVYAKPPFGGAEQALRYLGLYTHRVAISNERLLAVTGQHVRFQ